MNTQSRKPVLGDHVRIKRKLIPRFVAKLQGGLVQYSWTKQIVPDFIWIGLLINLYGFKRAALLCLEIIRITQNSRNQENLPLIIKLSDFEKLKTSEKNNIISCINLKDLTDINRALFPLSNLNHPHALSFLTTSEEKAKNLTEISSVLSEMYDRNARLSVLSMAVAYFVQLKLGKMQISEHLIDKVVHDLNEIHNYPRTDASRAAAGTFRAAVGILYFAPSEGDVMSVKSDDWNTKFWDSVSGLGECTFTNTLDNYDFERSDTFESFILEFQNHTKTDLNNRLKNWPLDLKNVEKYEVILALLCRQTTLCLEFSSSPSVWTPHTAPILLRAMADVFITFAWILKDATERAKRFVEDGLGAVKLEIAQRKSQLGTLTEDDEINSTQTMIDLWEDWLDSQRLAQLVEVNLGSWSGLSTRKMAEEAGVIDFYNYVYQPFSSVAHSNWAHISMFNTVPCENPSHRSHRSPALPEFDPEIYWLYLSTKYLNKMFMCFDEYNSLKDMPTHSLDFIESYLQHSDS